MKARRLIAKILVALLVIAGAAACFLQPAPLDVARAYCAKQGFQPQNLALLGYRGSASPLGADETVEFVVKGSIPERKLTVKLHRPAFFLGWNVVGFSDAAHPQ